MNKTIRNIVLIAVFSALFYVLDLVSIKIGMGLKITFSALPIIIIAMLCGSTEAMCVGFIGSLVGQIVSYGFTPTTLLWILPAVIRGLFLGLTIKGDIYKTKRIYFFIMILISGFITTIVNTGVIALDAYINHYFTVELITGNLLVRFISATICSVIYSVISPLVHMGLSSIVRE